MNAPDWTALDRQLYSGRITFEEWCSTILRASEPVPSAEERARVEAKARDVIAANQLKAEEAHGVFVGVCVILVAICWILTHLPGPL